MTFDDIDKIYFLHLADRYDREKWMKQQISQIGFPEDKISIWWACRRNSSEHCWKYFDTFYESSYIHSTIQSNPMKGARVFDCALEYYSMVRTSYERGFNNIMIFEDDVKFLVNFDVFSKFIEMIPDNYNIVKFHNDQWADDGSKRIEPYTTNFKPIPSNVNYDHPYIKIDYHNRKIQDFCSSVALIMDRNAMKMTIEFLNESFMPSDWLYTKFNYFYISNFKLVTTQDYMCNPSEYLASDLWMIDTNQMFNKFK